MSTIPSYQAVRETTRSSGAGAIKLDGPELGYQALGDVGDGNECDFCIRERGGKNWEVVTGIYSAATQTLTRATVIASSNGDQLVDFPAGIKVVTLVGGIFHAPSITTLPASLPKPVLQAIHPPGLLINGVMVQGTGRWIDKLLLYEGYWTSIAMPDLTGILQGFGPQVMPLLTAVDFPALTVVGGPFAPDTLPVLGTVNIPLLATVGGSFGLWSCPGLSSWSAPTLTFIGESLNVYNGAALETIDVPLLATVGADVVPNSCPSLAAIDLPSLVFVGGDFNPFSNDVLAAIDAPVLATIGRDLGVSQNALLTLLELPSLTSVGLHIGTEGNASLALIDLPSLTEIGGQLAPANNAALEAINLPVLATIGMSISLVDNPALASLSLPSIVSIESYIEGSNISSLASFTLGATLKLVGGDVDLSAASLNEASFDNILVRLASLDGTNGTTSYDNHTIALRGSPPSATALAAKATLEARGNTVTLTEPA